MLERTLRLAYPGLKVWNDRGVKFKMESQRACHILGHFSPLNESKSWIFTATLKGPDRLEILMVEEISPTYPILRALLTHCYSLMKNQ